MWADVDTNLDFLNYSEVAELTVDLIRNKAMRPLSIGIFGTWGTGKSTLLNLIEKQLNPDNSTANDYIIVRFDAWLYQGYDDARAALMEVIATTLISAANEKKSDAPLLKKAKNLLGRVNYFRAAGLLADGGAAAFGIPTMGFFTRGLTAAENIMAGTPTEEDVARAKAAGKEIADKAKGLIDPEVARTPPEEIAAFRKELSEILNELAKTLVVFVDNLDRCLPKQTIHTLEALRLFLFMPSTAFVVAADEDMVKHSVKSFFSDPDDRHVTDYLDKLIQVPVRVPKLGIQEVRSYMFLLFAAAGGVQKEILESLRSTLESNLRQSWKVDPISWQDALKVIGNSPSGDVAAGFEMADRMAALLANSSVVLGNPRIVKRMLNVVRMRSRLAARYNIPIDEAMIAKLALFERCTDASATADLYRSIQESAGGKSELFRKLEHLSNDVDKFKDACPESWKNKHLDFVQNWISLNPKLADVDLRPALYLSRETQPLKVNRGELSAAVISAVGVLLKVQNSNSPAAKRAIESCQVSELPTAMEAVIAELGKISDWTSKPAGFDGAVILAHESSDAGAILATFIRSRFSKGRPPPWVVAYTKNSAWFANNGGS